MEGAWSSVLPAALACSVLVALARTPRLRRQAPGLALRQRLGIVLLATPLIGLVFFGIASIPLLFQGVTPAPMTPGEITQKALLHATLYLLIPLVGLLLVQGPRRAVRLAADRLTNAPLSSASLGRTFSWTAAFTGLLLLSVTAGWTLAEKSGAGLLTAGGAQVLFSQITPGIALLLAAFAAIAEETLFRGVLQETLAERVNLTAAIVTQALLFGLIHAGYGSLGHVIGAGLFGLLMGILVTRRGLLSAILVHFFVNVAILGLWTGHTILLAVAVVSVPFLAAAGVFLRSRTTRWATPTPAT